MAFDFVAFEKCRQNDRRITKFHFFLLLFLGSQLGFFSFRNVSYWSNKKWKMSTFQFIPTLYGLPTLFLSFETVISKCCTQIQFINFYRISIHNAVYNWMAINVWPKLYHFFGMATNLIHSSFTRKKKKNSIWITSIDLKVYTFFRCISNSITSTEKKSSWF